MITNVPCISWEFEYILRILSLWPNTYNITIAIILWLAWITIIPFQLIHATVTVNDVVELMIAICDIASEFAAYSKLFIVWMNQRTVTSLLIEMTEDWQQSEIKTTRETRVSCFIARLDLYIYCGAIITFFPKLIIAYFNDIPENREFLLKTSYPFDDYKSPVYEIIIILQFVQGILMLAADLMPQAFIVALICHSATQFNILKQKIQEFVISAKMSGADNKNTQLMAETIIKRHQKIINFAEKIEKSFSTVSLIHCLCNGVAIGCSGLIFVVSTDSIDITRSSIYIVMKLVQTFIICYAGEYLTNQSANIANVIYESHWYELNRQYVKIFLFIILRAQKPLKLTAGKLSVMSSAMFAVILKASGSYMSMLRATYKKS